MTGGPAQGSALTQGGIRLGQCLAAEAQQIGRIGLQTFLEALNAHEDDDDKEESAVYGLLAQTLADDLGHPADETFRAVVALCGGPQHPLSVCLPKADGKVVAAVRDWLMIVRLRYAMPRSGKHSRTLEIIFRVDADNVRERMITQNLRWEDLPKSIRERQIRTGREQIAFQLYPRSA